MTWTEEYTCRQACAHAHTHTFDIKCHLVCYGILNYTVVCFHVEKVEKHSPNQTHFSPHSAGMWKYTYPHPIPLSTPDISIHKPAFSLDVSAVNPVTSSFPYVICFSKASWNARHFCFGSSLHLAYCRIPYEEEFTVTGTQ